MERNEAFEERTVEREDARRRRARVLADLPGELRTAVALGFGEGPTFATIGPKGGRSWS